MNYGHEFPLLVLVQVEGDDASPLNQDKVEAALVQALGHALDDFPSYSVKITTGSPPYGDLTARPLFQREASA